MKNNFKKNKNSRIKNFNKRISDSEKMRRENIQRNRKVNERII